jgi:hypothetical protein
MFVTAYRSVAALLLGLSASGTIVTKIALASDSVWGMILAAATGAFSSVGRAIARQAMGHRFESCNAHHLQVP